MGFVRTGESPKTPNILKTGSATKQIFPIFFQDCIFLNPGRETCFYFYFALHYTHIEPVKETLSFLFNSMVYYLLYHSKLNNTTNFSFTSLDMTQNTHHCFILNFDFIQTLLLWCHYPIQTTNY